MYRFILKFSFLIFLLRSSKLFSSSDNSNFSFNLDCFEFVFFFSEDGILRIKFESSEFIIDDKKNILIPNGAKITFYDQNQKIETIIIAKKIETDQNFDYWTLQDGVQIFSQKKEIYTDKLLWDRKKKTIESQQNVLIKTENGDELKGNYLFAKEDFSFFSIQNPDSKIYIQ